MITSAGPSSGCTVGGDNVMVCSYWCIIMMNMMIIITALVILFLFTPDRALVLHPPGPPPARGKRKEEIGRPISSHLVWRLGPPPVPGSGGDCAPSLPRPFALDGFRGPLRDCNSSGVAFTDRGHSLFLPRSRNPAQQHHQGIIRVHPPSHLVAALPLPSLLSFRTNPCSLLIVVLVSRTNEKREASNSQTFQGFRTSALQSQTDSIHCLGRLSDSIPNPQKRFSHGHRTPERETFNRRQTT